MQERSYRQISQWRHAMDLGVRVYREIDSLPEDDRDKVMIDELIVSLAEA